MADKYARILRYIAEYPWAMLPSALDALMEVIDLRIEGRVFTDEEIQQRIGAQAPAPRARNQGAVAVLPLFGVMAHRMNMMTEMSGGTSTEAFGGAFSRLVKDPSVSAIVLDVDSPGGSVFGVQELGDEVFRARGSKPIVAVANALAGSAAYWIASQADQVFVTPSGMVGSIGTVAVHVDRSKQAEQAGVKHTFITSGGLKAREGNDLLPLDAEVQASMQRKVDTYYDAFVRSVARGRGIKTEAIREGIGDGRVLTARDAKAAGMADGVATLDTVIERLAVSRPANFAATAIAGDYAAYRASILAALTDDQPTPVHAPMPEPGQDEDKDKFIGRCMGDDNMQEFDPDQRRAVCEKQWDGSAQARAKAERDDFRARLAALSPTAI